MYGENGKAASVRELVNGLACGTTEFFVLRPNGIVDQDYLFYFVRQESYRKAARRTMQSGIGQARIPKEFIEGTELPIPPLAEQCRIVAKIEALQERSRKARAALAEVGPLLEQFRQSLLAAAFRGDLTADWRAAHPDVEPASELLARIRQERREKGEQAELAKYEAKGKSPPMGWRENWEAAPSAPVNDLPELPETWCWATAEELTRPSRPVIYGILKPGSDTPDGVPYVRVTEMKSGTIDVASLRRCHPDRAGKFSRAKLLPNDILISKDKTIGKVALVPPELEGGNITQHVLRLSLSDLSDDRGTSLPKMADGGIERNWSSGD